MVKWTNCGTQLAILGFSREVSQILHLLSQCNVCAALSHGSAVEEPQKRSQIIRPYVVHPSDSAIESDELYYGNACSIVRHSPDMEYRLRAPKAHT